jgi:hypothetical protein
MRSRRGEPWSWAVALALLFLAASARGSDVEPIHIAFVAPSGCPDATSFLEQVRARTLKARRAEAGESARTFTVTVTQQAQRIHGRLKIEDPPAPPSVRDVSGEQCSEIVSALALITALAIDPRASTAPQATLPAPPKPPVEEKPAPEAPEDTPPPALPPPVPAELPAPRPGPSPLPRSAPPALLPSALLPRWRTSLGMHFTLLGAVAPGILPGAEGFLALERTGSATLSPAFRLSALWAESGAIRRGPALASFTWMAWRLEGCPLRFTPSARVRLSPCGLLDAGMLQAEGRGRAAAGRSLRPWIAPGLLGRLELEATKELFFEVEGGATFPLVRDTFYIAPATDVHRVPVAGALFAAGAGVRFF